KIAAELKRHESTLNNIFAKERKRLFRSDDASSVHRAFNILLIDDKAHDGWELVFKSLFRNAYIEQIVPRNHYVRNIEALYEDQVREPMSRLSTSPDPSIVFLDLRLFDETERSIEIGNVSGKLLLARIRKDFKGVPVLITTASNKIWSFRELINLGADAYWVKEGMD